MKGDYLSFVPDEAMTGMVSTTRNYLQVILVPRQGLVKVPQGSIHHVIRRESR